MKLKKIMTCLVVVMVLLVSMPSVAKEVNGDYIKPEEGIGDYIKPETVLIEGGSFDRKTFSRSIMLDGVPNEAYNGTRISYSEPSGKADVSSFYMGKYEVTNKEFCVFLNSEGVQGTDGQVWYKKTKNYTGDRCNGISNSEGYKVKTGYETCPVVYVTWYGAVAYCNWLSEREGLSLCYSGSGNNIVVNTGNNGYRLPSEVEWEYAYYAGSTTKYYWGDSMDGSYCWYSGNRVEEAQLKGVFLPEPGVYEYYHPVGQKKPNGYGLYDMSGNVNEWCWDFLDQEFWMALCDDKTFWYFSGTKGVRFLKGGSWLTGPISLQPEDQGLFPPDSSDFDLGFRLVRSAPEFTGESVEKEKE